MKDTKREEIRTWLKKIVGSRGNPILLLDLKEVSKGALLAVHELINNRKFETLDVVLQTPGGNIDAAFLIAKILREKTINLNIIVPLYAKSAGTLICLIADQILLSELSELGPLDTQIFEQQDGGQGGYTSALNGFKAMEQVQAHAVETLDVVIKLLLSRSPMKLTEAVHLATEFSGQTSGTLYSKLNPYKIGEYARALEVGEQYGILILTRYCGWEQEEAKKIITTLVKQYPSHGFIIDLEELTNLNLPAKKIDEKLTLEMNGLRKSLLSSTDTIIELIDIEKSSSL